MFSELRKKKNFTQEELAEKLEVKQNTISNWENGVSKPDVDMCVKIAKVLKCKVSVVIDCFIGTKEA